MSDDRLRAAFDLLEGPRDPDPAFRERLFEQLRTDTYLGDTRSQRGPTRNLRRVAVIAAALLIAALSWLALRPLLELNGVGTTPGGSSPSTSSQTEQEPLRLSFGLGDKAPAWTGQTRDGASSFPASLEGRPSAVYLWATWCDVCVGGPLDGLESGWDRFGNAISVVAVATQDDPDAVSAALDDGKVTVPLVLDGSGDATSAWGLEGIPALVLLDEHGRLVGAYLGDLDRQNVEDVLSAFADGEPLPHLGGKTHELLPP